MNAGGRWNFHIRIKLICLIFLLDVVGAAPFQATASNFTATNAEVVPSMLVGVSLSAGAQTDSQNATQAGEFLSSSYS